MPRREIDPDPVLRTVRAYTGAEFEGQLLNRGRGEQLEGVEVVNARDDSREPQRTVEQPGLRPVSATPPAADAHASLNAASQSGWLAQHAWRAARGLCL